MMIESTRDAKPGQMRERIVIQSYTEAVDSVGEPIKTWSTLSSNGTVWAAVYSLSGRELFAAQKINSEVNVSCVVRYRTDLTTRMRISWNSLVLNIHAVLPDPRKTRLSLLCSEVK